MGCRSAGSTKKAGCASRKRQSLKEPPARWRQRTIPCTGGRGDRPAESSMTSSQTALSGIGVMLNFAHVLDRVGRRLPLPSDWHSASPGIGALGVRASETGMLMLSSMTRSGNAFRRGRRGAHTSSRSAYRKRARIRVCRLPQESGQHFRKVGGMLPAPAGYFKYQSLRRQYAPQHFKDRLAVASDVGMIQAWIRFFGHPGSQQAVRWLTTTTRPARPSPPSDRACQTLQ